MVVRVDEWEVGERERKRDEFQKSQGTQEGGKESEVL